MNSDAERPRILLRRARTLDLGQLFCPDLIPNSTAAGKKRARRSGSQKEPGRWQRAWRKLLTAGPLR